MRLIFLSAILIIVTSYNVAAQGCVAIRSTGGFCTANAGHTDTAAKWSLNINNRYFKSFRHFVGTAEQKQRIEQGTEVINYVYNADFALTHVINKWWSFTLDLPYSSNTRSSLYEHGGKTRHSTHAVGLGDIRIAAYRWLVDPAKMSKGNIQVGLGIKFATGDYKVQDFFYTSDSTRALGPVDQSIQLGDGGTGFTAEVNTYYNFNKNIGVYGNFYYLLNPRDQNGVSSSRQSPPSASSILYGSSTMSVPDQYMARGGINYSAKNLTISAGVRDECLPAKDLVGGSSGFRRPGYVISIEPGITYKINRLSLYAFVPYAFKRDRTQSYSDKLKTQMTGVYTQGDAAFADYSVNIGAAFRF
ncbi:MAG TPA: hypothetical protein VKI61_08225 [Chitinophagaceae bacterium]|jgi:hypothetical protein|nr:hypothetical protein [Chitinophagaceae bacterium]